VSTEGKFKSEALDTDEKFSFAFNDPGTYEYYCSLHPKMTAKVVVK
jgi:plastocyanin